MISDAETPGNGDIAAVADGPAAGEIVLEATGSAYTYVGRDAEGFHHHHDAVRGGVLVTRADAEREADGPGERVLVRGPIDHAERGVARHELRRWCAFVAERRGWDDLALVVPGVER